MNKEKITTSANKKLSPEEIKRVKGLGCLQDKRYDDIFNIRVITGNGHITTDEHRAIGANNFPLCSFTKVMTLDSIQASVTFFHRIGNSI